MMAPALWQMMAQYRVSNTSSKFAKAYIGIVEVSKSQGVSRPYTETSGVSQGCVLSPLLFISYIDNVCNNANERNESDIDELLFADNQTLIMDLIHLIICNNI